ncbi:MAG: FHA domain-containing protein [Myxococcales bacterium]|nr:FHA domain-containing protein [Myxococcales bacterium]
MGLLRNDTSGTTITLQTRTLIGRSAACELQVSDPLVSGEHALLHWDGDTWVVRDLASSNGTFLQGERLAVGAATAVTQGQSLRFATDDPWSLVDAGPPEPSAALQGSDVVVRAQSQVLLLPSEERPVCAVFAVEGGGWVCESDRERVAVTDRQWVSAGGDRWRLSLPTPLADTLQASEGPRLYFSVSRDEEFVALDVEEAGRRVALGHRGYTYLLLTLARQRLAESTVPEPDRGWLHQDDLAHMLRINASTVNVHVYRARQHASRLGIRGASGLVERRMRTRQLRIGTAALAVAPSA